MITVSFPHLQHIFSLHFTWPHSSFWDYSSSFPQQYFLVTSVPTLWSSSLGCLHCLLCRAGKCWFEDQVQALFLPLLFFRPFHADPQFQSSFQMWICSPDLHSEHPCSLGSLWPNWWSHTDTHQVLCSLLWQMVSPLSCKNENLGIVLDTCPFIHSKSIYHQALLTSSSYMFLNHLSLLQAVTCLSSGRELPN